MFEQRVFDLLVLDEASQLSLPEAIMASLALRPERQIEVVGDHRRMSPIVMHDRDNEARRTFKDYAVSGGCLAPRLAGTGDLVMTSTACVRKARLL